MEGPSLVIAVLELRTFRKLKVLDASGNTKKINLDQLKNSTFIEAKSWGKHLLLYFSHTTLRVHFLMYGSYRIDDPKPDRSPRLHLKFKKRDLYLYSCSVRELNPDELSLYNWSVYVMSEEWNAEQALATIKSLGDELVCDVLMNQQVFSGVGNIIKNEVLFRIKVHPETRIKNISSGRLKKLVYEPQNYSEEFFEWKVLFILKSNWKIMRKKECPACHSKVQRRKTGKLERWSFYCEHCQPLSNIDSLNLSV